MRMLSRLLRSFAGGGAATRRTRPTAGVGAGRGRTGATGAGGLGTVLRRFLR